jgi:hypothetical protein
VAIKQHIANSLCRQMRQSDDVAGRLGVAALASIELQNFVEFGRRELPACGVRNLNPPSRLEQHARLVSCTSAISPSFEDEIVKPTFFVRTGRTIPGSSATPSKVTFGLFTGMGGGVGARVSTDMAADSGALTSPWAGGPTEARGFDNLNHSTRPLHALSRSPGICCSQTRSSSRDHARETRSAIAPASR